MFGIAAIVVMLCSFDMEYDELLANLRRAGMWLPAVVGLWIIIYLFNTLSWYIIIRDGKNLYQAINHGNSVQLHQRFG